MKPTVQHPIKTIPVDFINEMSVEQLAVDEEGLWKMLGLDNGKRSVQAMKKESYEFRAIAEVPKLPGGIYPLWAIINGVRNYPKFLEKYGQALNRNTKGK